MRIVSLLVLLTCGSFIILPKPAQVIHIPLTVKTGYGPFYPAYGYLSPVDYDDPVWGKCILPVRNKPVRWQKTSLSRIDLDLFQFLYQNTRAGRVSEKDFRSLFNKWKVLFNPVSYSAKPIKCYVYVVTGYDPDRQRNAVLIDTNNNLDFSDETPVYPEKRKPMDFDYHPQEAQIIHYQQLQNGKPADMTAPLVIKELNGELCYSIPLYGVARFNTGGHDYTLLASSLFSRTDFKESQLVVQTSSLETDKIDPKLVIDQGEYVQLGNHTYKFSGVDLNKGVLTLEPVDAAKEHFLQVGLPFSHFTATNVINGKPIITSTYKGKYLFIDFWGTWCQGCVEAMPKLKHLYPQTDRTKIEFISVACHDNRERLKAFINKNSLTWPQVFSSPSLKFEDRYHVKGFPRYVLINPEGTIIWQGVGVADLPEQLATLKLLRSR